ncbi:hypothetical protein PAECIP111893_02393 [Paenibacillus plantiphilus]|uniref:Uncharacterized protein n=1 Tax=Paenibacillus plantiphilus TaxID=2905650 RepID=A0ABN8GCL2_9BACL|nr:hypothetical protein [Paenibacillus plantiphilus]CAH1205683.1 hypothetical protein PAECIP111893_02393 [Paenibacillus plantiphilus]
MKATINGVSIEGTPQEIAEYQRIQRIEDAKKPHYTGAMAVVSLTDLFKAAHKNSH